MKLEVSMVPQRLFGKNLRKVLKREQWDRVRKAVYKKDHHACHICKARGRLEAHEQWHYHDILHEARMIDIIALCGKCHKATHLGMTEKLAKEKKINLRPIIAHYCRLNHCDELQFAKDKEAAYKKQRERNQYMWYVTLAPKVRDILRECRVSLR